MAERKEEKSYFGHVILLMALAILMFGFVKRQKILPDRLFENEATTDNANIVVDSMALMAMSDNGIDDIDSTNLVAADPTLSIDSTHANQSDSANVTEVDNSFDPSIAADGYVNLQRFYNKLSQLENDKSKKVRVAYFGDSMNDGDFIVQDVRSQLQEKFGGQGVGFVSISSLSAGSRGSLSHQYSKGWQSQSFIKVKKPRSAFGIDGQVSFSSKKDEDQWVKYKASSRKHSTSLYQPTLFYGRSNNDSATVSVQIAKEEAIQHNLNPSHLLNTLQVASTTPRSLQVTFQNADSIPIYGFNFDDGQGIHVDNFSMRGNSGLPLSILNTELMNSFDNILQYDLIILQYGTNVLGYGTLNYGWYEKGMSKVVKNLQRCFPNADILVISTADRSIKVEEEMKTDPAVAPLARAQKNYARANSAGYINLSVLMGGSGSMMKWVDSGLAGKDYTHFTGAGSRKIANLICTEIDKGYTKHTKHTER